MVHLRYGLHLNLLSRYNNDMHVKQKAEDYYSPAYFLALLANLILVAESLEAYRLAFCIRFWNFYR